VEQTKHVVFVRRFNGCMIPQRYEGVPAEGELSSRMFRDRLCWFRKFAQAWLEYADAEGVTRRLGDYASLTRLPR